MSNRSWALLGVGFVIGTFASAYNWDFWLWIAVIFIAAIVIVAWDWMREEFEDESE